MKIGVKFLWELPDALSQYLLDLDASIDISKKAEIPVYYKEGDDKVFFISDFVLRDNKAFEKTAPAGLYRGGALMKLLTKQGQVVIFDERYKWLRLIGGIARFNEGDDLIKTAIRETVIEELAVLADSEKIRLIPTGMGSFVGLLIPGWDFTTEKVEEAGSISVIKYLFNDVNKAFELVVEWDISDWDGLTILHSEDWFKGGRSGFIPFVINDEGKIVGLYDGRHGFVPMPVETLHPTLKATLLHP